MMSIMSLTYIIPSKYVYEIYHDCMKRLLTILNDPIHAFTIIVGLALNF